MAMVFRRASHVLPASFHRTSVVTLCQLVLLVQLALRVQPPVSRRMCLICTLTRLLLPTQSLKHNSNGRFVTVCGDGEYVIYTALAWRNKSFGR